MDAYCIPCPGGVNSHHANRKYNASAAEKRSLIAAVRAMPAGCRLPEATLLDIVKRHAEHRMAIKHGGNQRQTILKCVPCTRVSIIHDGAMMCRYQAGSRPLRAVDSCTTVHRRPVADDSPDFFFWQIRHVKLFFVVLRASFHS